MCVGESQSVSHYHTPSREHMVRTHTTVLVRRAESQSRRCCKHSDVEVGDLAEATPELGGVPQRVGESNGGRFVLALQGTPSPGKSK